MYTTDGGKSLLTMRPVEMYCLLDSYYLNVKCEMEAIALLSHYSKACPYFMALRGRFMACLRRNDLSIIHWALALCRPPLMCPESKNLLKQRKHG